MTPEEYLEWEAKQEFRHEYVDGEILAMTGGSIPHNNIIALNFYRSLYPHLCQKGCQVNVSDVKVRENKNRRYFYLDLVITCNADDLKSHNVIEHPKVIIEIIRLRGSCQGIGNSGATPRQRQLACGTCTPVRE
ncbi:Uma2 family endonuclease [Okeania sp. SIO3I5]|uniref:Uma2 family endonuclease n=1 Tax=Okeania sp. SIO3I5 TaxID=2607805 RepID=UPI0025CF6977|nr:Uma2 family endonuclease [Okeania sp. SIO3I5]